MITINVDWLEDITSPSMIRMLSYTLPPERREDEDNFVDYVTDRLASLICPPRSCGQDGSGHHYFLRRKLDGERLYATYDGGHLLCLSNGQCLDLQQLGYQKKGCAGFFSVDFVYQIEKLGEQDYYFTEIVAARHSYSTVLSSLVHSFSPSRNYYRATDEQIWPYALIGTGLDNHATASLVDFWTTSACSETAGFLTREFVERLRGDGRRPPVSLCRKKSHALSEQNGQSGHGTDDEAGSVSSLDPVLAEKKTHE